MNTPQLAAGRPAAVDLLCTIGEGGSIQVTFRTPNGQPYDASAITQFRVVRRLVTLTGDVTVSGANNEIVTATITPALAAQLSTERGWRFMLSDPTAPKTWVAGAVVAAAPAHAGILSPRTDVVAVVDQVHITVVVAGPPGAAAGGGDLSDATPEAPGTPAAGTAVVASRGDHVHAPPTAGQIGAATPGDVDAAIAGASLDGSQIQSGTVPDAHIPSSIARDSEVSAAVSAHAVAVDPHGDRAHAAGLVDDLSGVTNAATARSNLGLGNVDNTSDANKPVSTAQQTALDGKVGTGDSRLSDARTPLAHTHAAGDLVSGTVGTARLGSGTANATTFLRGDQTWAAAGGGGGVTEVRMTTTSFHSLDGPANNPRPVGINNSQSRGRSILSPFTATGTTQVFGGVPWLPWSTVDIWIDFLNANASAGDVKWQVAFGGQAGAHTQLTLYAATVAVTAASGDETTYGQRYTQKIASAVAVATTDVLDCQVVRLGDDAADTLAGSVWLKQLRFREAGT